MGNGSCVFREHIGICVCLFAQYILILFQYKHYFIPLFNHAWQKEEFSIYLHNHVRTLPIRFFTDRILCACIPATLERNDGDAPTLNSLTTIFTFPCFRLYYANRNSETAVTSHDSRGEAMSEDIGHIFNSWRFDPGEDLMVRIIRGDDNRNKVQMRIDMGLMQMEIDGHPAGEHPEGEESWLDYFERRRNEYETSNVDDYFSLDEEDARKLRREGIQYYYRYLTLMKLEDYPRVARDTDRNLRLFDFVRKYADSEADRWALDQYRPYVIMMNTRARASLALREDTIAGVDRAVEIFDAGIGKIVGFYNEYGIASELENSLEISILKSLKREFLRIRLRESSLEDELETAVREERFEDAASLRDRIRIRDQEEENSQ